jgi:hypothetical protein
MDKELAGKVMVILSRHIGEEKAVGMGDLYERAYGQPWRNKINDTRRLRKVITDLRYKGALIGETRSKNGGGYYLARSVHELNRFFDKRKREALKKLMMVARMQRVGLPELLGQIQMHLRTGNRR